MCVCGGGRLAELSSPLTHTHYNERQENRHSRLQERRPKVENFPCEECKHNKNHCSLVKLESKKQAKKTIAERKEFGWKFPIKIKLGVDQVPSRDFRTVSLLLKTSLEILNLMYREYFKPILKDLNKHVEHIKILSKLISFFKPIYKKFYILISYGNISTIIVIKQILHLNGNIIITFSSEISNSFTSNRNQMYELTHLNSPCMQDLFVLHLIFTLSFISHFT